MLPSPPSYPENENAESPVGCEREGKPESDGELDGPGDRASSSSDSDGNASWISLKDLGEADAGVNSLTADAVGLCVDENCSIVGVMFGDLVIGGDVYCGRSADIADGGGGGEISIRVGLVRS